MQLAFRFAHLFTHAFKVVQIESFAHVLACAEQSLPVELLRHV